MKLAFEYNGLQHYEPVSYYGGEKSFERTRQNDIIKRDLCKLNGVRLITIPYNYTFSNPSKMRFFILQNLIYHS